MSPTTRYARSADVNIAYQVVGDGPLDLVLVPGWVSQVEAMWDEPTHEAFPSSAGVLEADSVCLSRTQVAVLRGRPEKKRQPAAEE